jgi:hypothetical protein
MSRVSTSVLLFLLSLTASAQPAIPSGSTLALRDAAGGFHQPLALGTGSKAAVLIFIANDCPISNSYAPEINRITAAYSPQGITFYLVDTDTAVSSSSVAQHARQYSFRCPVLLDAKHILVQRAGATVTPEAAIYTRQGLVYRGRIDDKYADFGQVRFAARTHDLRNVLDAIVALRPVRPRITKAVGCPI